MLVYWKPLDEAEDDISQELNRQDSPKSKEMKDMLNDRGNIRMRLKSEFNVADSAFSDHSYLENVGRMVTDVDRSAIMEDSFKRTVTGNRSNSLEGINPNKEKPRK